MSPDAFLELSTRLVNDMKAWSEEATRLDRLSTDELAMLKRAAEIVDRITVAVAARGFD